MCLFNGAPPLQAVDRDKGGKGKKKKKGKVLSSAQQECAQIKQTESVRLSIFLTLEEESQEREEEEGQGLDSRKVSVHMHP